MRQLKPVSAAERRDAVESLNLLLPSLEYVAIEDTRLIWRFSRPGDRVTSPRQLARIATLTVEIANRISDVLFRCRLQESRPFGKGWFLEVESLNFSQLQLSQEKFEEWVRDWLLRKRVTREEAILLHWGKDEVALTDWFFVAEHFADVLCPSANDLTIFPVSLEWCLFVWHEGRLDWGNIVCV